MSNELIDAAALVIQFLDERREQWQPYYAFEHYGCIRAAGMQVWWGPEVARESERAGFCSLPAGTLDALGGRIGKAPFSLPLPLLLRLGLPAPRPIRTPLLPCRMLEGLLAPEDEAFLLYAGGGMYMGLCCELVGAPEKDMRGRYEALFDTETWARGTELSVNEWFQMTNMLLLAQLMSGKMGRVR